MQGDASTYPGQRFGLPEQGSGSVSAIGRRLLALLIDWLLCTVIALAVFHSRWETLLIFAIETYLLTALTGFTIGKRILGIRVVRLDGRPVGLRAGGWCAPSCCSPWCPRSSPTATCAGCTTGPPTPS